MQKLKTQTMKIDKKLLAEIKKGCEKKMNAIVLKEMFAKGLNQVSTTDLELAGFNVELILNEDGNQNPESLLNELPFYAQFHYEGFSLKKDEGSSLYDPNYQIEKNELNSFYASLSNMRMKLNYEKNKRENTEWAWQNEF